MINRRTLLGLLGIAVLLSSSPAWGVDLDGGTETFKFPQNIGNQRACIVLTNKTRANICDFVVTVCGNPAPFNLTSVNINDDNQPGEDWDVDDNNDGMLQAGETDTMPPAPAAMVRIEERGKNQCVNRGRSVTMELQFNMNPRECDEIKISPTGTGGGILFLSALPANFDFDRRAVLFPTGEGVLLNNGPGSVLSLRVTPDPGISVVSMTSPSHGGSLNGNVFSLSSPFSPGEELRINFQLSGLRTDQDLTRISFAALNTTVPVLPGLWAPLAIVIFALGGGAWIRLRTRVSKPSGSIHD